MPVDKQKNKRKVITESIVTFLFFLVIGIVLWKSKNKYSFFLISGLTLIVLIFISLVFINRYRHKKKIYSIIKSYSGKPSIHNTIPSGKSEFKGWSMNNSPFRKRKSGVCWGGGNIKGANATRGKR